MAASLKSDEELVDWFQQRLVWDDPAVVVDLLKRGLFSRIYTPQVVAGSGLGSGHGQACIQGCNGVCRVCVQCRSRLYRLHPSSRDPVIASAGSFVCGMTNPCLFLSPCSKHNLHATANELMCLRAAICARQETFGTAGHHPRFHDLE